MWKSLAALAALAMFAGGAHAQQDKGAQLAGARLVGARLLGAALVELPPQTERAVRGAVYAPAHSAIRFGGGRSQVELAATLSLHNTSRERALIVERVDYFDTDGKLVQSFVQKPGLLGPLATLEVFVPADDLRGGTGANFLVEWSAAGPIVAPAVETVMIGSVGTTSYSFVSVGRPIEPAARK